MVRPLTWWLDRATSVELNSPTWLEDLAQWRAPPGGDWVLWVAVIAAVAASVRARAATPGFALCGLVSMLLACQWFGVRPTLVRLAIAVGALVVAAVFAGIIERVTERGDSAMDLAGVRYSLTTVTLGVVYRPGWLIIGPVSYPVLLMLGGVRSLGVDFGRPLEPHESTVLDNALRDLTNFNRRQGHGCGPATPSEWSALVTLLTAVQVTANDERARRRFAEWRNHEFKLNRQARAHELRWDRARRVTET